MRDSDPNDPVAYSAGEEGSSGGSSNEPKVAIVGSGAMGSLFGGMLTELGWDVQLYDIWENHVEKMNDDGLTISKPGAKDRSVEVRATADHSDLLQPDIAFIFVKSTQTRSAMEDVIPILSPDVEVLTLQNGFGNPEIISEYVPEDRVIAGVTEASADLNGPGHITHTGTGTTTIGRCYHPNDSFTTTVAEGLTAAGLKATVTPNIRDAIWKKVLVNLAYNPLSALTRCNVGEIIDSGAAETVIEQVVDEAVTVGRVRGRAFEFDPVKYVLDVGEKSRSHTPSMLQDIDEGRRTEIEFLNGALVDYAEEHDIAVPTNRLLANLVRLADSAGHSA